VKQHINKWLYYLLFISWFTSFFCGLYPPWLMSRLWAPNPPSYAIWIQDLGRILAIILALVIGMWCSIRQLVGMSIVSGLILEITLDICGLLCLPGYLKKEPNLLMYCYWPEAWFDFVWRVIVLGALFFMLFTLGKLLLYGIMYFVRKRLPTWRASKAV